LMSMLGIDSGDASKFSTTDRSVPKTDFEAMYGGDRGSLDAASMTDSELLDMFNREYPDTAERFLTDLDSQSFDEAFGPQYLDEVSRAGEGASIDDLRDVNAGPYDPEYVPDGGFQAEAQARDEAALNALMENDQEATLATAPDGTPVITANNGFTVRTADNYDANDATTPYTDEYLAAEAAAQARDDAGIVDDFDPSIAFTDDDAYTGLTDADYGPTEAALADAAADFPVALDATDFTQVPFSPLVNYEIVDRKDGLQAALQTVSRKSGLKFPDGEAAIKALKSQGVTDAELEARGLMSLKGLTNFDGTAAAKMLSGFQERMMGGKFSDDIDLSPPITITELRDIGTEYDKYFTKGGTDYLETVYTLRDSNLGPDVSNKLKNKTMGHHPDIQQAADGPTLFHTRSAVYEVGGGGSTFHLGEIQSDVNNNSRTILKNRKILEDLGSDRSDMLSAMYYTGGQRKTNAITPKDQEILDLLEGTIFKKNIVEANDSRPSVQAGYSERFSQLPVTKQVDLLMSELTDLRNTRGNKTASELGVGKLYDTATITRMAIRRSLEQASVSGADFFTLGTGQMATDMTYGELGGQQEYYDKIVPGALKKVLNKLGADSKLEMPKIEEIPMYGADEAGTETMFMVPGFRMTDNFRKALSEVGMPVFRDGGRVDVSRFTGLGSMGYML